MAKRRTRDGEPPAPRGLRSTPLPIGDGSLMVFSYPLDAATGAPSPHAPPTPWDLLSASEREVARALIDGLTSAEIGAARGRSTSTIHKQIESIYRKLGVHSRGELCALHASERSGGADVG